MKSHSFSIGCGALFFRVFLPFFASFVKLKYKFLFTCLRKFGGTAAAKERKKQKKKRQNKKTFNSFTI